MCITNKLLFVKWLLIIIVFGCQLIQFVSLKKLAALNQYSLFKTFRLVYCYSIFGMLQVARIFMTVSNLLINLVHYYS